MNFKSLLVAGLSITLFSVGGCRTVTGKDLPYNYQVNGSFEYGTNPDIPDFWSQTTVTGGLYVSLSTAGGYAEFQNKWRLDTSQYYDGKQSLLLEKPLQLIGSEMPIPLGRDEPIVASVYMKAVRPDTQVQIGLGKRLDCNRGQACIAADVTVGTSWERYQVKLIERDTDLVYFFIIPKSEGRIWVDAVQIENANQPGTYAPSTRDAVFKKTFFSEEQSSVPVPRIEEVDASLLLSVNFNEGKIPEGFDCKPADWRVSEGALCRTTAKEGSRISFGRDDWDVGAIEFKFMMQETYSANQDAMMYLSCVGGTIRVTSMWNVIWMDALFKKDRKAGMILVKEVLDFAKWHTMKVVYRNNVPVVFVDGEYVLTGGPFAKKGGKITIGCWMLAAAIDDIKVYAADSGKTATKNYQFNSGFELSAEDGVPDSWFQKVLTGGVNGEWTGRVDYVELHPRWHIDTAQSYEGKNSLLLEKPLQLISSQLRLPYDKPIIASVYMKAVRPDTQVQIGLMDNSDKTFVSTGVKVGTSWERYEVKTPGHDTGLLRFFVVPQSEGGIWVDAVQLETGETATPYVDSGVSPPPPLRSFVQSVFHYFEKTHPASSGEAATPADKPLVFSEYTYYTSEKEGRLVVENMPVVSSYLLIDVISREGVPVISFKDRIRSVSGRTFINLPFGKCSSAGSPYNVRVTAYDFADVQLASAETTLVVLPPAKTEVKINRLNRGIYVNGEPFIPYSTFMDLFRGRKNYAGQIAFLKENGMNTLFFPGDWVTDKFREDVDGYLEEAAKQNMRVMILYDMRKHDAREIFSWLKGKEAVIGVAVADEISPAKWVDDAVRLGKEINPYILTFINHNVLGLKFFEDRPQKTPGDICSIDYYPVSPSLTRLGLSKAVYDMETVIRMLSDASVPRHMPMNYWMQGGWSFNRCVTPLEVEWFNYLAIVYGTKSFSYYIGIPQSGFTWSRMGEIGRELETLKPVLFSYGDISCIRPADTVTEDGVKFIAKRYEGRVYLIAVNRLMKECNAEFDISKIGGVDNGKAEVLFEDRAVKLENGKLCDLFGPLGRHVYVIECR